MSSNKKIDESQIMKKLNKLEQMADDYLNNKRFGGYPNYDNNLSNLENKILHELSEIKNSRINSESKLDNNQHVMDHKIDRESAKKLNFDFSTSPNRDNSMMVNKSIHFNSDNKEYRDNKINPYESNPIRRDDSRQLEDITIDNTLNDNSDNLINLNNSKKNSMNNNEYIKRENKKDGFGDKFEFE